MIHAPPPVAFRPRPASRRPLYVMLKPPAEVAARLWRLPRVQADRGADLLHVTLLRLFDLAEAPDSALTAVRAALANFRAPAVAIAFTRVRERRCITLCGDAAATGGVRGLQRALADHLAARGLPRFAGPRDPHLTISYRGDGLGDAPMAPIGWEAERALLVESVVGQTRHVLHGAWPLMAGRE